MHEFICISLKETFCNKNEVHISSKKKDAYMTVLIKRTVCVKSQNGVFLCNSDMRLEKVIRQKKNHVTQ